jgi:hypothetical protein
MEVRIAWGGKTRIIELDLQTAYDVVGLARYFGEWTDGIRAALHDILGIVVEIYAANGQWRAAQEFTKRDRFLRVIDEIAASADQEFETRKTDDWFDRFSSASRPSDLRGRFSRGILTTY